MFKNINIDILKDNYMINENGSIKSLITGKILKAHKNRPNGYFIIRLVDINGSRKTYHIHRLVIMTFGKIPDNFKELQVNHIDGNKENNNIENLEWVTSLENMKHAVKTNLVKRGKERHNFGKKHSNSTKKLLSRQKIGKLNPSAKRIGKYDLEGNFLESFDTIKEAAINIKGSASGVSRCVNGITKKYNGYIWKEI